MSSNEAYDCFVARTVVVAPRLETESRAFRKASIRGAAVGRADPRVEGGAKRIREAATGAARQASAMSTARGNTRVLRVSDCEGRTRFGHSRKARDASTEIRDADVV